MRFKFNSVKPTKVSKEEIRAICHACDTILSYHGKAPTKNVISVNFKTKVVYKGKTWAGLAYRQIAEFEAKKSLPYEDMVTTILHEMIHLYIPFSDKIEKKTSTLTAKLKPDVVRLANILVENTYKRAAYVAHCSISYGKVDEDHYDDAQWKRTGEDRKGKKYQRGSK